jgi:hypothetical protein
MFHEIADADSTPAFKCNNCDKLLHTKVCCDGHMKICKQFKECASCGFRCFEGKHNCQKAVRDKMFTPAKLHTETPSCIVYDIESMFVPYKTDEENKKYVRIHQPWLIWYEMMDYVNGTYEVNTAETFKYSNDLNGVTRRGNFIIGDDCCVKFM